jgi:uncharacterized protein (TIGR03663 family)
VNRPRAGALVVVALAVLAAALRFPALAARPMHADEAVHADKLGTLLEGGGYAYDPVEFHGPTLYYLTLVPLRLEGARRYVEVDEAALRAVPAAFGTLLVLAHLLARPTLGLGGALWAALFAAISPAMVYYSRYYIHEMLLVAWSFGALLAAAAWLRRPSARSAAAAGFCAGLMLATKETAVIALGALFAALAVAFPSDGGDVAHPNAGRGRWPWPLVARHLGLAAAVSLAVAALFFSSLLQRPAGLLDPLRAIQPYLERASQPSIHEHPWHYYLALLVHFPAQGTPFWSEGLILALAAAGALSAWTAAGAAGADRASLRMVAVYTAVMIVVYSAIPYKTPWCLLGFLHGLILLAGAGVAFLARRARAGLQRFVLGGLLAAALLHLGYQAYAASFPFAADPRGPYVYAHTSDDVFAIAERLQELAAAHPQREAMPLQVISRTNLWPLPFYLRRLTAVEWWTGVADDAKTAPVVVVTPEMEPALVRRLYDLPEPGERELYVSVFERPVELRPGVELRAYASARLWEAFRTREAEREATRRSGADASVR